jgi:ActR/RegA family two-component response regulator
MADMIDRLMEKLESVGGKLEDGLEVMTTLRQQNQELRTLVLALQERLTTIEGVHGGRLLNLEHWKADVDAFESAIANRDRGIGRSP